MAQTVCVLLSTSDRTRLEATASDRNQPRKYIERVLVVLASADRRPVQRVVTEVAVSRPMVWRWQQRFAEDGSTGQMGCCATRRASPASLRSWPGQWRVWWRHRRADRVGDLVVNFARRHEL